DGPPREVQAEPAPPLGARPSGEPRDPFEGLRRLPGGGDVLRRGGLVGAVHACQSSIDLLWWQVVALLRSPPGGPTAVRADWSRPWPGPGRATPRPPLPEETHVRRPRRARRRRRGSPHERTAARALREPPARGRAV